MRGVLQPHQKGKELTLCFGVEVTKSSEDTIIFAPLPLIPQGFELKLFPGK